MSMRRWVHFIVLLAFVVTAMPGLSHAGMPHDQSGVVVKSEKAAASAHAHCAGHGAEKKESPRKSCCTGQACQCLGGGCNGAVKIPGGVDVSIAAPPAAKTVFLLKTSIPDVSFYARIKRPPRA